MTKYSDSRGRSILLIKRLASSGEGEVWESNRSGYLAKIYHSITTEQSNKLQVMVANPPEDPTRSQNHISIAWPQDLLKDSKGNCIGFLMPAIEKSEELIYVYSPQHRRNKAPTFNWYYLHATAYNFVLIVQSLHAKGYVIGDIKPQNLLVNDRGLVSIIDTDSFQVNDPKSKKVYRCPVGSEGFIPPELIGKDLSAIAQTRYHDRFRIAIIIHLLLFGYHPYHHGKWTGFGNIPEPEECIRQGFWLYGQNSPFQSAENTIPLNIVHPEIKKLFLRCFNDGHISLSSRPSAKEWCEALQIAIADLTLCSQVTNHSYSKTYGKCYWCERVNKIGLDIFPSVSNSIKPPQIQSLQEIKIKEYYFYLINTYLQFYQKIYNKSINNISPQLQPWIKLLTGVIIITILAIIWGVSELLKPVPNHEQAKIIIPDTALQINADSLAKSYYDEALRKVSRGEYEKAISEFTQSIKISPNQYTYSQRGAAYLKLGNYQAAIDDYTHAIEFNPNSDYYYNERASAYYNEGNFREAINDFTQAIKNAPDDGLQYFNRGNAYYKMQDYMEAIEDYKTALNKDYGSGIVYGIVYPKLARAYYNQGLKKSNLEENNEAIGYLNQAIELNSNDDSFYYARGRIYHKIEKYQEAIEDYTQATRLSSSNVYYYNQRGFTYYSQRNFQTALNDYTQAIKLNSTEPTFYTNRGGAYEQLGNIQEAINDFHKAAELYSQQGNTEEYKKRINKIKLLESQLAL
ncbi:tetratricopeptide repeat protein [Nostoc sp. NMS8]|uniref:tetratricopeptide repeat protein n=1 Tax=Nostoc sp. NMS8 TaxID=2815392 RepID=UPI0025D9A5BA|nr:tetratricopeptide repeat protein [Nostoc sp. NMS8]MBN3963339.1 tetratricopeptide repeat protein [Nostoc sp. NMS8]